MTLFSCADVLDERLGNLVWARVDRRGSACLWGHKSTVHCSVYNPVWEYVGGGLVDDQLTRPIWGSLLWNRVKAEVEAAR